MGDSMSPLLKLTVNLLTTYKYINEAHTADSTSSREGNYDDAEQDYVVRKNECWMGRYIIYSVIGKGSFGQVVKARDLVEERDVAIKIIKNQEHFARQARVEISILQLLNQHDPTHSRHVVRLLRHFEFRHHLCLVFEKLSVTLYDLLASTRFTGLPLSLVRRFAAQILSALDYLACDETNVIHADLKPENVLLRDSSLEEVLVIDFGSSCRVGDRVYPYIQSRYYRSPEVLLGLQYTQAIDMWSLGCILPELVTGDALFNGADEADQLYKIVELLGMPSPALLGQASKTAKFFEKVPNSTGYRKPSTVTRTYLAPGSRRLADVLGVDQCGPDKQDRSKEPHLHNHYNLLLDLVQRMLVYDPDERLTPRDALAHEFFTVPMPPSPSPTPPPPPTLSTTSDQPALALARGLQKQKPASTARRRPHRRLSWRSRAQSPVQRMPPRPRSPVRRNIQGD